MAYKVILLVGAEHDVDEIILWYEEQQTGLGIRFYSNLNKKLNSLKQTPGNYSFIYGDYRRLTIDPFPYSIIYKIDHQKVLILAILHQRRNPAELLKRIQ